MTICDNIFDWEKQLFIMIMKMFESLTSCKLLCIFDKNCKSDTITSISETWCLSSSDNCILEGFLQRDLMIFRDNLIIWCWRHLSQQAIRPRHTYVLQMSKWWNRKQTFFLTNIRNGLLFLLFKKVKLSVAKASSQTSRARFPGNK